MGQEYFAIEDNTTLVIPFDISISKSESVSGLAGSIASVFSKHIITACRTFRSQDPESSYITSPPITNRLSSKIVANYVISSDNIVMLKLSTSHTERPSLWCRCRSLGTPSSALAPTIASPSTTPFEGFPNLRKIFLHFFSSGRSQTACAQTSSTTTT